MNYKAALHCRSEIVKEFLRLSGASFVPLLTNTYTEVLVQCPQLLFPLARRADARRALADRLNRFSADMGNTVKCKEMGWKWWREKGRSSTSLCSSRR